MTVTSHRSHGSFARRAAAMAGLRPVVGILTAFWIYVTLSNVLYAASMSVMLAAMTKAILYAPWNVRVLQHALMYPALLLCVGLSLRLGWQPLWRTAPVQVLLGVAFSALGSPLLEVSEALFGHKPWDEHQTGGPGAAWFSGADKAVWLGSATSFLLTYGFALALVTGFSLYRRFRDGELRLAALEQEWSAARLSALRMQLSPHTLFNLLNTIRGYITWDPAAAQAMVVQFADFLRRLLNAGEREFASLADEVSYAGMYLDLQRRRFQDRLTVALPDHGSLATAWVPSLILQPLVENAVVHGLAGHKGSVNVRVEVQSDTDHLTLRVVNTMAPGKTAGPEGIGLRNVRERLALQFGAQASFSAGPAGGDSWVAQISIPLVSDGPQGGVRS